VKSSLAKYKRQSFQVVQSLTRACSGWPQHTGDDSKTFATAEAQAVLRLKLLVGAPKMRMSRKRFARYKNGKPHFAECEVRIDFSSEGSTVVVDCNGRGFYSQGYIESVSANGYDRHSARRRVINEVV
jgi:hypothetical protein